MRSYMARPSTGLPCETPKTGSALCDARQQKHEEGEGEGGKGAEESVRCDSRAGTKGGSRVFASALNYSTVGGHDAIYPLIDCSGSVCPSRFESQFIAGQTVTTVEKREKKTSSEASPLPTHRPDHPPTHPPTPRPWRQPPHASIPTSKKLSDSKKFGLNRSRGSRSTSADTISPPFSPRKNCVGPFPPPPEESPDADDVPDPAVLKRYTFPGWSGRRYRKDTAEASASLFGGTDEAPNTQGRRVRTCFSPPTPTTKVAMKRAASQINAAVRC